MTGPDTRRRQAWVAASVAALAVAGVVASCGPNIDARPQVSIVADAATPSPSASPSQSPLRPSPSPEAPSPSAVVPIVEPPLPPPRWEAASTLFKTRASALKRLARLKEHGYYHYRLERDGKRYEVEREFTSERLAAAEVRRLARGGFKAHVEPSTDPT